MIRTTIGAVAALLVATPATALATERVSVSSHGEQGNAPSYATSVSLSADGRFVAFDSSASNLVGDDTNGARDVFVRDRLRGRTTRVSTGRPAASDPAISEDGRIVAYVGVTGRLSGKLGRDRGYDVFVHDRRTGRTVRVSRRFAGAPAGRDIVSFEVALSGDGRYVAYTSQRVGHHDTYPVGLFLYDRSTRRTTRLGRADWDGSDPSLSRTGSRVAFAAGGRIGRHGKRGVYVLDRRDDRLRLVAATGLPGDPAISADGRHVAFERRPHGSYRISVKDLRTGRIRFAGHGVGPAISRHGGRVAFQTTRDGTIGDNTGPLGDVLVRDVRSGRERTVSATPAGRPAGHSGTPALSDDGHMAAFSSSAPDLVPGDTNGVTDVFSARVR